MTLCDVFVLDFLDSNKLSYLTNKKLLGIRISCVRIPCFIVYLLYLKWQSRPKFYTPWFRIMWLEHRYCIKNAALQNNTQFMSASPLLSITHIPFIPAACTTYIAKPCHAGSTPMSCWSISNVGTTKFMFLSCFLCVRNCDMRFKNTDWFSLQCWNHVLVLNLYYEVQQFY